MKNAGVSLTSLPFLVSFPFHLFTWTCDAGLARDYLDENCFSPLLAWPSPCNRLHSAEQKWEGQINTLLSICKGIFAVKSTCISPEQDTEVWPTLWGEGSCVTHNPVQNHRPTRKHAGSCLGWLWTSIAVTHFDSLLLILQTCAKFSFLLHLSTSWNMASLYLLEHGLSPLPLQQYLPQLSS